MCCTGLLELEPSALDHQVTEFVAEGAVIGFACLKILVTSIQICADQWVWLGITTGVTVTGRLADTLSAQWL